MLGGSSYRLINTQAAKRHDSIAVPPVKDRPRLGHIGFQFLSRDGVPVEIRGARIKA